MTAPSIDIPRLVEGLALALRDEDFPAYDGIVRALDLDVSAARTPRAEKGKVLIIHEARLRGGLSCAVVGGSAPRRELMLLLSDARIPYSQAISQVFGPNQRLQHSRRSAGFAVLFDVSGFLGVLTVSGPQGTIETLGCEERRAIAEAG